MTAHYLLYGPRKEGRLVVTCSCGFPLGDVSVADEPLGPIRAERTAVRRLKAHYNDIDLGALCGYSMCTNHPDPDSVLGLCATHDEAAHRYLHRDKKQMVGVMLNDSDS